MKNINEELNNVLWSFRSHITRQLNGSFYNTTIQVHSLLESQIHQQLDFPIESQLNEQYSS